MDNDIKPRTILLIDNEADIQKSFTAHLASQGYRVLTAKNSQAGLNILENEQPDIVLTALHMPEGNGLEVVKRGTQLYPEMPIIVMAEYDQSDKSIQAIELGAWDYMVKSTNNLPILDHVIGKAVEKARLLQENHNYREKLKHSIEQASPSNNRSRETNRSQQLLLALSQAAQAVQRAHTPEAVYHATCEEIAKLGFDTIIFTLSNEKNSLIISYLTLKSNIIQIIKRLLGFSVEDYRLPLTPGNYIQQILDNGETFFDYLEASRIASLLPKSISPLAERIARLLGWQQYIVAPLTVSGDVWGILAIAGTDLTPSDVPAITAFANQAAAAIENAQLYKETQQLALFNQRIIENITEGITIQDTDGDFTFVNPAAAKLMGYTPSELIGMHWTNVVPPDQQHIVKAADERRLRGNADRYELEIVHQDGKRTSILVSGTPRFSPEGHFDGTMAIFTDITERKQIETALQESEERLNLALRGANLGLWDWDIQTGEIIFNARWAYMLGYIPEELDPHMETWKRLIHPEDLPRAMEILNAHMEDQTPFYKTEYRMRTKDGNWKWISDRGKVVRWDKHGTPKRAVGTHLDITERKQAEEDIKYYYHLLESVIKQAPFAIHIVVGELENAQVLIENDESKRLMGEGLHERATIDLETPASIMTRFFTLDGEREILLPDMPSPRALRGEVVRNEEYLFRHPDGTEYFINANASPIRNAAGDIVAVVVTFHDITTSKRTEQALRESEERYRTIFNNSPLGIFRSTFEGRFIEVNQALARILGYDSPEDVIREIYSISEQIYLYSEKRQDIVSEQLLSSNVTQHLNHYRRRDGSEFIANLYLKTIHDAEGQPLFLEGIVEDITEHRQMEQERERLNAQIREQAQQMEQILATVPAGVLLLNSKGFILQANRVAEDNLAVLSKAKIGDKLTHLGDRPLAELLTSPPTRGLWHEVKTDKNIFEVIARPVENSTILEHWVLVLKDVSREREIQAQLQQQEQLAAVGQLAAGIAHDFNNIMAIIVLYAQMGLRQPNIPPTLRERIKIIDQQAKRASDMIQQILDFSRRAVLARQVMDMTTFLEDVVKLLKRTLPENIKINFTYEEGEYTVKADPTRLQQAILNLALNARDAMPGGGELYMELAQIRILQNTEPPLPEMQTGEWVRINVTDSGHGIPPDVMEHLFEPFFTTKEVGKGTGLGLAQVFGIVKQHNGHIDVITEVGIGTTFTLYLPALLTHKPESPLSQQTLGLIHGQNRTILVVEDNAALRMALAGTLELMGYRVMEATDGREALEILTRKDTGQEIKLVLSDLVMPEMGGQALFQAMKQQGLAVPVVMLSGHPMENELEKLEAQGLAGWMLKPPNVEELAQLLAQVLK